jgi:two-component system invasion response regulator UvrY
VIKILVADDHPIVRQGLKQTIADTNDMVISGEASNGQEVIDLVKNNEFNVVLLDIKMPGIGGMEVLQQLRSIKPALPVLILSVYPEEQYGVRVIKSGAAGYIRKDREPAELLTAIRTVASGKRYISPELAQKLADNIIDTKSQTTYQALSDREFSVLRRIVSGKEKKTIAAELSLSPQSVSTYRSRLLKKLGLNTDADLVRYAIDNHLLE